MTQISKKWLHRTLELNFLQSSMKPFSESDKAVKSYLRIHDVLRVSSVFKSFRLT